MVRDLVVVGASAGGVEALRAMVHGFPRDLDAAVLVVLHIPPGAPSALPKILARSGPLPAVAARDGELIKPSCIYVAPADQHMLVRDGQIALSRGPAENGHRPAVDPLFRSAAQHYGARVIGVILSGSRDDGTAGLAAIVERGGIPIVQDPDTALHRSMPCAAMEHLTIEYVLHPGKIGKLVAGLVTQGPLVAQKPTVAELPADELLAVETAIAELTAVTTDRLPGRPTGLSCPSCHGAMLELDGAPSPRYRCRVGHAWSPDSLLAAQSDAIDGALWTALRALEEQAALSRQLAALGGPRGSPEIVDRHLARADHTYWAARQIRRLLGESGYQHDPE
ncbi:MAG: chemotaxis protein CheB [Pseudonocardiales bacterium]